MVSRFFAAAVLGVALLAGRADAQQLAAPLAPACRSGSTSLADACQKATDLFAFMVPQLGAALAGGTAFPGGGDGSPGARGLSVATRLTTVAADLPQLSLEMPEAGAAQRTSYRTRSIPLPAPALDVALGLGQRLRLGPVVLPGAELLLNLAWVPAMSGAEVGIAPSGRAWRVGLGARVGLVAQGPHTPALSVSWQERALPALDVLGTGLGSDDTLAVQGLVLRSRAWRVTAQRTGDRGALWASAGGDQYLASGRLAPVVREDGIRYPAEGSPDDGYLVLLARSVRRANASAGASLRVGRASLLAEAGLTSGGRVATYNDFGGRRADDARYYGSLGIRVN